MKDKTIKILVIVVSVAVTVVRAWASPWALPVKAAVEASEKVGAHVGGHATGKAAVRGGTALAAATAKHEAARAAARSAMGKAVDMATPGRILAVGGATALVVGAHEVADGVQTMGESVGKAVEGNPEAAVSLGDKILSIPKSVAMLVTVVFMAVLTWLFWPLISLTRNWIRFMSMRKARKFAVVQVEDDPKHDVGNIGKTGFARIGLVWIVAFLLLTALGVWRISNSPDLPKPTVRTKTIDAIRAEYKADVDRIYRAFLSDVDSVTCAEFGHVRAGMPAVVEKFGTLSRCASLVKTMVTDKLSGANETEKSVTRDLEPFYSSLYEARDGVTKCVQRLVSDIESVNKAYDSKIGKELAEAEQAGDNDYKALLEEWGENIDKCRRNLLEGQIDAGVAVAVEAVCIRGTLVAISRLLGTIVARQAGTMAASIGAAVADGPFPVGDILGGVATVGCTLWTGWDVYKAKKVLPEKLAEALRNATDDCERQCREEARKIGADIVARL